MIPGASLGLALARKPPCCFHNHSKPAPLTLTSAFMWPDPEADLKDLSMLINEPLQTRRKDRSTGTYCRSAGICRYFTLQGDEFGILIEDGIIIIYQIIR